MKKILGRVVACVLICACVCCGRSREVAVVDGSQLLSDLLAGYQPEAEDEPITAQLLSGIGVARSVPAIVGCPAFRWFLMVDRRMLTCSDYMESSGLGAWMESDIPGIPSVAEEVSRAAACFGPRTVAVGVVLEGPYGGVPTNAQLVPFDEGRIYGVSPRFDGSPEVGAVVVEPLPIGVRVAVPLPAEVEELIVVCGARVFSVHVGGGASNAQRDGLVVKAGAVALLAEAVDQEIALRGAPGDRESWQRVVESSVWLGRWCSVATQVARQSHGVQLTAEDLCAFVANASRVSCKFEGDGISMGGVELVAAERGSSAVVVRESGQADVRVEAGHIAIVGAGDAESEVRQRGLIVLNTGVWVVVCDRRSERVVQWRR